MATDDTLETDDTYGDDETTATESGPEITSAEQVNKIVSAMVKDDNDQWVIPEEVIKGAPELLLIAAKAEKRVRDTQSSYTRARQKVKELETINTELTGHLIKNATMHLTTEEREELEDLRVTDQEKWRDKLNEHEQKAQTLQGEKVKEFEKLGKAASESDIREAAYAEFTNRTGIVLSDEVMENQLPASFSKKLSSDEWTFDKFLVETEKFLKPSKKSAAGDTTEVTPTTSMRNLAGGNQPADSAIIGDIVKSYKNEVY